MTGVNSGPLSMIVTIARETSNAAEPTMAHGMPVASMVTQNGLGCMIRSFTNTAGVMLISFE